VRFLARGFEYRLFGLLPMDRHWIGVEGAEAEQTLFLLGTDEQGRDLWSRLMYATQTSLSIGLAGVAMSLILGVLLGGISGLYGGILDTVIQRVIEILRSIPTIPLWMGLAAALPNDWSIMRIYFAITIIISLIGWTELARVVRGRFLSLREEDFVMAAELAGCGRMRIIFTHLVPSFLSHIIAATTLAILAMIISDVLSWVSPPTGHQLGRTAAAGAERPGPGHLAVAPVAGDSGHRRDPGVQLHGGRPPGCGRPVWPVRPTATGTAITTACLPLSLSKNPQGPRPTGKEQRAEKW
jgi:ABC-type methionine transport system permease subunit